MRSVVVAALLLVSVGCVLASNSQSVSVLVKSDNPFILYSGRVRPPFGGAHPVEFDWSGITIILSFNGTKDISALFNDTTGNIYAAWIDGVVVKNLTTSAPGAYQIATGLDENKQYTVTLVKLTEALFGVAAFEGFNITGPSNPGAVSSPPLSARRIEVIGDSITCGYGILGTPPCGFSAQTESNYMAYGSLLAREFSADLHTISWSGRGLVRNYDDPNPVSSNGTLPDMYNRTLANMPYIWPTYSYPPQAIIINLGTNDYSTQPVPPNATFINAYGAFAAQLRSFYSPSVRIFALCGPMISGVCCGNVQAAATQFNMTYVNMQNILTSSDIGCDSHPNLSGHAKMAKVAGPIIAEVMSW